MTENELINKSNRQFIIVMIIITVVETCLYWPDLPRIFSNWCFTMLLIFITKFLIKYYRDEM